VSPAATRVLACLPLAALELFTARHVGINTPRASCSSHSTFCPGPGWVGAPQWPRISTKVHYSRALRLTRINGAAINWRA
jgi:hypothetical protein